MERLPEELVRHVGSVELGRVDVIDPASTARRMTARAWARSLGGPNTPGPGSCMAPKPIRRTGRLASRTVSLVTEPYCPTGRRRSADLPARSDQQGIGARRRRT